MKKILLCCIVLAMSVHTYRIIQDAGVFRSIDVPVDLANCQELEGPIGAEDITIDPVQKIAFISADDRRAAFLDKDLKAYENGGIWLLDLSDANSQPKKLDINMMGGVFHPHGIALRFSDAESIDKGRAVELYVVNHMDMTTHEIVVFTISPAGELTLRRRISYPDLISPNDIVVIDKDQFFVSNDHGNPRHTVMELLEDYLGLSLSSLTYFDGVEGRIVIDGLRYTNGLALSADKETLYIAETSANTVSRFQKGEDMSQWTFIDSLNLEMGVDNLEWDGKGNLLNAGHPKIFDFLAHIKNQDADSPSQVTRINVSGKEMVQDVVYLNKGDEISGASVAAQFEQQMLVGSVFESHFLRCSVPN